MSKYGEVFNVNVLHVVLKYSRLSHLELSLRVVSQRLGHNSTTVTNDIYTHVIKRADEMAAVREDDF